MLHERTFAPKRQLFWLRARLKWNGDTKRISQPVSRRSPPNQQKQEARSAAASGEAHGTRQRREVTSVDGR
jgi:hypothetical protein